MDLMTKIASLCKRRGFVFPSSEIYGGLRSFYDFGPLGVELKKNISSLWWQNMVEHRDNVVGLDASIIMSPKVWKASGHLSSFSDPLVDCKNCQTRFRADKQPKIAPGTSVSWYQRNKSGKKEREVTTKVGVQGYVCPECGSTELSQERPFSGMFRTFLGPIDPVLLSVDKDAPQSSADFLKYLEQQSVYLRPETAQAMFVQFLNVQKTTGQKVPFGIAQLGKSFRNEIVVEHFIFRSCEFEQMEMEFFCEPGSEQHWLEYWCKERLQWYQTLASHRENFRLRAHLEHELAHYSDSCFDIEYQFPWGWDELEGVASRGDYDLSCHGKASGAKLSYFDPHKKDPASQKQGWRYVPKVIEPAAGLTRAFLCFLLDAYTEESTCSPEGKKKQRVFLKLHPALAPYQVAILPLLKEASQVEMAQKLAKDWRRTGIKLQLDVQQSIGKRYAKHDEIGTPFAVTIDHSSLTDHRVTLRDRDTTLQQRLSFAEAKALIQKKVTFLA